MTDLSRQRHTHSRDDRNFTGACSSHISQRQQDANSTAANHRNY